jgi:hypothetical protein
MQLPPNGWHPRPTWASLFTNTTEMLEGFRKDFWRSGVLDGHRALALSVDVHLVCHKPDP